MKDLEYILMHFMKTEMMDWMSKNPDKLKELIQLSLSDEKLSWRASWLLWCCIEPNDNILKPYLKDFIFKIDKCPQNKAREFLKILLILEIPKEEVGKLFDSAVKIWMKISNAPSLRMNAFKTMYKIAKAHPELKEEMHFLSQRQYLDDLSVGVKQSIKKILKDKYFK